MTNASRKDQRTREIRDATRALFDSRGMRDAQIEDIAKAVGINRAIIYRHFTTKEELFAMTLVDYLDELEERLAAARSPELDPIDELRAVADEFIEFGIKYPAFVDCAQALLRFRGADLIRDISPNRLIQLGAAMNRCIHHIVEIFERGNTSGHFSIKDPTLLANVMYTQGLGFLNLLTFQRSVRELDAGIPVLERLPMPEAMDLVKDAIVALATTR